MKLEADSNSSRPYQRLSAKNPCVLADFVLDVNKKLGEEREFLYQLGGEERRY